MKKIFAALFVSCLVAAAAATAQSVCDDFQNTQAFKGTITMKVNWVNNGADTNCDAWDNDSGKLDFYMVLCYAPVICPICPVEVFQAEQWVVNRNVSPVEIYEVDMSGEYTQMIDLGANNIAVLTDLPYLNADPYLALVGKRTDKFFCTDSNGGPVYKTTIKSLETYFGDWTISTFTNSDFEVCTEGDEIVYGTVSLSPFKTVVPKVSLPDCPTCPYDIPAFDCAGIIDQVNAFLDKKYPAAVRTAN